MRVFLREVLGEAGASLLSALDLRRRASASALAAGSIVLIGTLWVVMLAVTKTNDLGTWGLTPRMPALWFVALAAAFATVVVALRARLGEGWLAAHATLFVLIVAGTPALVDTSPRIPSVFKHVAVTRLIEVNGAVNPQGDIYQRWPGFFSWTALVATATGQVNPVTWAYLAEVGFTLLSFLLVLAIVKVLVPTSGWAWAAAVLFTVTNWTAQNYFAPQPLAYNLLLFVVLVLLLEYRSAPNVLGRWLEAPFRLLARATDRGEQTWAGAPTAPSAGLHLAMIATYLAIVASHQLTPYIGLAMRVPLVVLGYLRPWWIVAAFAGLTLGYLYPNIDYVKARFGLFTGLDPLANATAAISGTTVQSVGKVWADRGFLVISGIVVVLALIGLLTRLRAGEARSALVVGWLAFSPALLLVAQSYGGEGRIRVYLFALPWLVVAAVWGFAGRSAAPSLAQVGRFAAITAVVSALFVASTYQPDSTSRWPTTAITVAEWMDGQIRTGDVVAMATDVFPSAIGQNYGKLAFVDVIALRRHADGPLSAAEVVDAMRRQGNNRGFVVLRDGDSLTGAGPFGAGEIGRLEDSLEQRSGARVVYHENGFRIIQIGL